MWVYISNNNWIILVAILKITIVILIIWMKVFSFGQEQEQMHYQH